MTQRRLAGGASSMRRLSLEASDRVSTYRKSTVRLNDSLRVESRVSLVSFDADTEVAASVAINWGKLDEENVVVRS